MDPFATASDLLDRYPASENDDDQERYSHLLAAASRMVRSRVSGIDERTDLDFDLVKDVVCEMVWTAVSSSTPGATQQTQSVGSVSVSTTYETAAGRLRLTRAQMILLRPARASSRASSIDPTPALTPLRLPGTEYPGVYPWWR